jgi:hypothetical protein
MIDKNKIAICPHCCYAIEEKYHKNIQGIEYRCPVCDKYYIGNLKTEIKVKYKKNNLMVLMDKLKAKKVG